ncbi:glutamate ABC transporter substrate-binding protein [Gephyromycinifex aptenodytis]|uniref:glutamate ABC transporter substrate-binding protein n=1 Tax=Gephyromycinifex aptenodytis TaxID=2716227 RepID=UPI00144759FD|nr:glutamate ABC transporter substrate-binding protein [Gephyromycinifex aptenodytis]
MTLRRTAVALSAAALLIAPLAACGSSDSGADSDTIKVGIKYDQPGMGLKEGSKYTGMDVDVANYIAKELGKTPEFTEAVSSQRETFLKTGKVDYIVGTYSITDARKKDIDFAGPYFVAGQDLLVKTDSPIDGPDAMSGKKMCSVKGSTSATKFKEKYPAVQIQEYDTYSKCVEAIISGSVDALTTDNTILAGYAAQPQYKGKLKVVGKPFSEEKYGVGIKKGDKEMCTKVTAALEKMISSGEWKKIIDANLGPAGFTPDAAVNPPKPEACA